MMDYSIKSILERRACAKTASSVDALKASLTLGWDTITKDEVHGACQSAIKRSSCGGDTLKIKFFPVFRRSKEISYFKCHSFRSLIA